jgi:hypothetical protein
MGFLDRRFHKVLTEVMVDRGSHEVVGRITDHLSQPDGTNDRALDCYLR